jgi:hypothetical protein
VTVEGSPGPVVAHRGAGSTGWEPSRGRTGVRSIPFRGDEEWHRPCGLMRLVMPTRLARRSPCGRRRSGSPLALGAEEHRPVVRSPMYRSTAREVRSPAGSPLACRPCGSSRGCGGHVRTQGRRRRRPAGAPESGASTVQIAGALTMTAMESTFEPASGRGPGRVTASTSIVLAPWHHRRRVAMRRSNMTGVNTEGLRRG